ncbi:hypothetical protein [Streptomyces radicis]|uniref:Secreted protein n=1 Tax=Streptomyces radicis TaxID=1750517 RepID=A0A3A9W5T4_9ACTN|nr:hypothetical protein [Streptomyces radicis]RKN08169.1 hypothetical protein D7319_16780 [Streptomyces radicis]RKN20524.1 hypothetical protein D7318_18640 [Streptomyces radicis]
MKAIHRVGIGVAALALSVAGTAGTTAQAHGAASVSVAGERFHSEHDTWQGCEIIGYRGQYAGAWNDYRCVFAYLPGTYWLYVS